MDVKEKALRLKMSETYPRILAREAKVNKEYLTVGMLYKIKIVKINGTNIGCTSVTVESESNLDNKHLNISGGTELIAYDKNLYIPANKDITDNKDIPAFVEKESEVKKAPALVEKESEVKKITTTLKKVTNMDKGKKINMSGIINPLLMEGKSADVIADAVIKAIPEGGDIPEKASLVRQIRGPRRYNLIKKLQKDGKEVPAYLLEKEKK